ncbi:MAG: C45 family peptidase [Candidatus Binatia bacterium]
MARRSTAWTAAITALLLVPMTAGATTPQEAGRGRREDRGALILLDVYGSYGDMGRQEVELLGAEARALADLFGDHWGGLVRSRGAFGAVVDRLILPFWTTFGGWHEDSGMYEEAAAIARALDASSSDGMRYLYGGVFGGGSTVFAATRSATADGRALIGRNVDWSDDTGRRRPLVTRYHPTNGDLAHLSVSWPLIIIPLVGLNEAGLAVSINFFDADDMIGLGFPRFLYRRILQKARTVDDALALLAEDGNRGGPGMLTLADATGAIALAECAAKDCAVFRPTDDWFGHSNHSRTPEMRDRDHGRTDDTDRRRLAMEAAVRPRLGTITPAVAAEILRDRSNSSFINDATVANLRVLNPVVVDPARRLLWHSTTQQPLAPFGEMIPIAVGDEQPDAAGIPADPRLGSVAFQHDLATVAAMRQASRLFAIGRTGDAGAIWDRLAVEPASARALEPRRLAWARARVRWSTGKLAEAEALLARADVDEAPFEVRAHAKVVRGMIAERQGHRPAALAYYRSAETFLDAHPTYDAPALVGPLRRWIRDGLAAPATASRFPAMPDLQCIPQ